MIRAFLFDLDGTLVQTEKLKAKSYAQAAVELCPYSLTEAEVIAAFKDVVGRSRQEVAETLIERFDLAAKAEARMAEFGVRTTWQAFVQVRLKHYERLLADPDIILSHRWPHTLALLDQARRATCKTGLATMSYAQQAHRLLEILGLHAAFDFVATRDDVTYGKPDPEIYHLVARNLGVPPEACLVVEDSPAGVQAGLAAGMHVVAIATPFIGPQLHAGGLLPPSRIVNAPDDLPKAIAEVLNAVQV